METLDFKGDFDVEKAKLDGRLYRVNTHIDGIISDLDRLSTAWQDKDSETFIANCKSGSDEIKTLMQNTINDAKNDFDEIAEILNS